MGVYVVTAFDGTTITGPYVELVGTINENFRVIRRDGTLENGTKYDADATADADYSPGSIVCRYQVFGSSTGNASLNAKLADLEGLSGKYGTLTATVDAGTKTCNARCVNVITEEYTVNNNEPISSTRRLRAYVTIEWEKFSYWVTPA